MNSPLRSFEAEQPELMLTEEMGADFNNLVDVLASFNANYPIRGTIRYNSDEDFDEPETHRRVIDEIEQQQDDAAAAERDEAARAALAGAARARITNPDPARRVRQRRGNVVIVDLTGQESLTNNVVDLSADD